MKHACYSVPLSDVFDSLSDGRSYSSTIRTDHYRRFGGPVSMGML